MTNVGVIGCGRIGQVHATNLKKRAPLVFCSQSGISARRLQSKFGGTVCDDINQMLRLDDVEAVVIATPPHLHASQVVACLQAGKSVLVEKPLGTSMAEVETIEAAAAAASPGCFVMVAENYYYKPSLLAMKALIVDGCLGRLRRLQVRKLTRQVDDGWKSGYGALLEGGIHFVALISDLVDAALSESGSLAPPTAVEADFPTRVAPDEIERHSVTTMRYTGDVSASLHYAWDTPSLLRGTFQHSRVEGDAGRIVFESNGLYMHYKGSGCPGKIRGPQLGDLMGYGAMTSDFLACVADPGRRPYSDLARAKRDLALVFAAYGEDH
jgi:predicted dehydrogenase